MRCGHHHFTTTTQAAAAYLARGWRVVRVPAGSKGPRDPDWPDRVYQPEDFEPGDNIGIVLGSRSGGLVDVDLDAPEAVRAADYLLPPTGLVGGRPSAPRSHRFYVAPGARAVRFIDPDGGSCLVELRADGAVRVDGRAAGFQTLTPPSKHPSGEHYVWYEFGEPARVEAADLLRAVRRVAAAALLARKWRDHVRHFAALALAGALYRAGWPEDEAARFVEAVCAAAGDPEVRNRLDAVKDTYQRAGSRAITGFPTLTETLGLSDRAAQALWSWLGLPAEEKAPPRDDAGDERPSRRESQATRLIALVRGSCELWHAPSGDPFLTTPDGRHIRLRERDTDAVSYLSYVYFTQHGEAPSTDALTRARDTLIAIARFEGPEVPAFVRVAQTDGRIYVDLGGPAVEIWAGGWRVVERPPARFWRPKGMLPLPQPERGTDEDLAWLTRTFRLTDQDRDLLEGVLVSWLRPEPPYFILQVTGEPGSGKSTLSRLIVALLDPRTTPLRGAPREERDVMIRARRSWLVTFSNLSGVPGWLSDALCRLASGEGFDIRTLYTDDELEAFEGGRPVLLNGVPDLAAEARRSDLADRTLSLLLDRLPPEAVRPEAEILAEFEALRPRMLGALYERVAAALRNFSSVRLPALPRMADAAKWVTASEPPERQGAFVGAVFEVRLSEGLEALQNDPVGRALMRLTEKWRPGEAVERRPADLFDELKRLAGENYNFPRTPATLGTRLRRLGPLLRQVGLELEFSRRRDTRLIVIRKSAGNAVTPVTAATDLTQHPNFSAKHEQNRDGGERGCDGGGSTRDGNERFCDGQTQDVTAVTADLSNFRVTDEQQEDGFIELEG